MRKERRRKKGRAVVLASLAWREKCAVCPSASISDPSDGCACIRACGACSQRRYAPPDFSHVETCKPPHTPSAQDNTFLTCALRPYTRTQRPQVHPRTCPGRGSVCLHLHARLRAPCPAAHRRRLLAQDGCTEEGRLHRHGSPWRWHWCGSVLMQQSLVMSEGSVAFLAESTGPYHVVSCAS